MSAADGGSVADHIRTDPELDTQQRHVSFIEHFANTQDMLARLGVLERGLPVRGRVTRRAIRNPGTVTHTCDLK